MTVEQARNAIKELGEFVGVAPHVCGTVGVRLTFVKYDTGARNGKFHKYRYLTVPKPVYEVIKHELK